MNDHKDEMAFIYSLVFRTGHFYIGSTTDPARRFKEHQRKQPNRKVKNFWNKFGAPVMHILVQCSKEDKKSKEQEVLDLAFSDEHCKERILNINRSSSKPFFGRFYKSKKTKK